MKRTTFAAIAAIVGFSVMGIGTGFAQEACLNPETLTFSIIPTEETSQEVNLYQPLLDRLEENTGKQIDFFMPTSYASVITALMNGWVHIGVLGPASYVIAKKKDPTIEVFTTYAKKPGHLQKEGPGYQAVLITRADSEFDTIDSLEGALLGLVDPASTSGNLLPRVAFDAIDGTLEDYFSKVVYTGGHDLSTLAVKEGRVDAAFVATHRFDNVIDRGLAEVDDFQVLWESKTIPGDPFVYQTELCPELKEGIRKTFLTLHEYPEAQPFLDNINTNKFVPMTDADYDIIRELAAAKEKEAQD